MSLGLCIAFNPKLCSARCTSTHKGLQLATSMLSDLRTAAPHLAAAAALAAASHAEQLNLLKPCSAVRIRVLGILGPPAMALLHFCRAAL